MHTLDTLMYTFLKLKSEVYQTIIHFKNQVETQFNRKNKALQTDVGGAFRSLDSFLFMHGIYS